MFERYTEKARRVIFFARYEASTFGSPYIETEHLLLGLFREDKALANTFLGSHEAVDSIRKEIEERSPVRERTSTSVDLPLSLECKRILAFAAEEAERAGHKHLGTIHLLAGLLRESTGLTAEILETRDVRLDKVRGALEREKAEPTAREPWGARVWAVVNDVPAEMKAEIQRRASDRGIKVREYLRSLLEKALNTPPVQGDANTPGKLKETYQGLRSSIEAEGLPLLDEDQLEREIARRKGVRGNL